MPLCNISNTTLLGLNNKTMAGLYNSTTCPSVSSEVVKISKLSLYSLILLTSIFGNIFIITMVYKRQELRKTVNVFIVNSAVSDVLFSLSVIPVEITAIATESFQWHVGGVTGGVLCKFYSFAKSISSAVSAQSLVWIAVDRFVAILFPMKIGLVSPTIRITAIVSSWITAIALTTPVLITWELAYKDSCFVLFCSPVNTVSVFPDAEASNAYWIIQLTFILTFPFTLMTLLYAAIAIALKRRTKALVHVAAKIQSRSLRKQKRAVQMCFVIMTAFYICVVPQTLLYYIYYWTKSCIFLTVYSITADILFYSSAAVNPIICVVFVESYRRGLKTFCAFVGV